MIESFMPGVTITLPGYEVVTAAVPHGSMWTTAFRIMADDKVVTILSDVEYPTPDDPLPEAIALAKDAVVRRYAPDSVKFADAQVSTLAEVKVGDQARARGEKNADGSKMVAEEVLAGTFRTIAATVTTIDSYSPTSLSCGVPLILPVFSSTVAQGGRLSTMKVSASPSGSPTVG